MYRDPMDRRHKRKHESDHLEKQHKKRKSSEIQRQYQNTEKAKKKEVEGNNQARDKRHIERDRKRKSLLTQIEKVLLRANRLKQRNKLKEKQENDCAKMTELKAIILERAKPLELSPEAKSALEIMEKY